MANSPVDKSKEFIASGMTLITDYASERYLSKRKRSEDLKRVHRTIKLTVDDYTEYYEDM